MKIQIECDWCGKVFEREAAFLKGKKHHFCSRQCLADFSNKSKNPEGYADLKDFTNISAHMSALAREVNPTKMTPEVRRKLRHARLGTGEGKSYTKIYGRHEHRVVAEKMLGRALHPGEIVHHRDGNKLNNSPGNLVVFQSQSEHAKHHSEMNWFIKELEKIEGGDAE